MIILYLFLGYTLVVLTRSIMALVWNEKLENIAINEIGKDSEWYFQWNSASAIYGIRHWNKWTTKAWLTYQKYLYPDK